MPAAAHDAPPPGAGSTTVTLSPAEAARHATARPITPPPTTARSPAGAAGDALPLTVTVRISSLRRHYPEQVLRSAARQPPSQPGRPGLPWGVHVEPTPVPSPPSGEQADGDVV